MCQCCSIPEAPIPAAPVPQSKTEELRLEKLRELYPKPFVVHTSLVFNPINLNFEKNLSFEIDPAIGLITGVIERTGFDASVGENDLDLRKKVVLPGFVDAHTHIFLHSYDEADNAKQKRDESFVERVLRATNHCSSALLAGYTTYRDLGSEGMQEADANFRDAINRGIIPGPRLYVATKVLASVTGIMTHTENRIGGTRIAETSEACDGEVEIRKAVRRRLGMGCDVVKFFADYRKRVMRFPPATPHPYLSSVMFPPEIPNPDVILYTQEEMNVLCEEAASADCPVAAHCATNRAVQMASKAGVRTIEHAFWCDQKTLDIVKENKTIIVPTLSIAERLYGENFPSMLTKTYNAWKMGITQACGGDTGTFNHGENIREAELFRESGVPVEDTLRCLTFNGWLACGGHSTGRKFGWLAEGCAADIVAVDEDPRQNFGTLRKISFVMKDGKPYKMDGIKLF
ncbi:hypothetical protein OGAPHI_000872 [Ogataea philodendri]|uniref:Amidohydrolase-related domain-containing protein n=1 Tax=Ogataea philodendri TaxID=1378263 RepID=A0A9P8T9S6_9ASCO|nr:uncharacterized protein OGAPHI_000872 [Ogataea philodendri]KAH3671161.1 hypothetical protein OGAPHI_000872 [Ogataea philodendri]